MHSRCLLVLALLATACGSDNPGESPSYGYVEGPFWAGARLEDPLALGARATIRFWNIEVDRADVLSSNPSVATFELTETCLCIYESAKKRGVASPDCAVDEVWDCYDDIAVTTHASGDTKLTVSVRGIEHLSANIQVRDVAGAGFLMFDGSLPLRPVEQVAMNRGEHALFWLRLNDASGAELFSGEGPGWAVTDPALLSLTGRGESGPITEHPVETTEVFAHAVGAGQARVTASFAGIERTLPVTVY